MTSRTKCPKCGEQVVDELISCSRCGVFFSDYDREQLETLRVHREQIVHEVSRAVWSTLRTRIYGIAALLILLVGGSIWQIYERLTDQLQQRIAAEFEEPKVRSVLEEVAKTRASEIIEAEVKEPIEQVKRSTEERFSSFKAFLDDTQGKVNSAVAEIEFLVTVQRANDDDRAAVTKLWDMSRDQTNQFAAQAEAALTSLVDSLGGLMMIEPQVKWREGFEPKRMTREQFVGNYRTAPRRLRSPLLSALWASDGMTKLEKLDLLAEVIRTDDSVRAANRACMLMNNEAKIDRNFLGAPDYLEWWAKERPQWVRAVNQARKLDSQTKLLDDPTPSSDAQAVPVSPTD